MKRIKRGLAVVAVFVAATVIGAYYFLPAYVENGMNVVKAHDPYTVSDKALALHESLVIGDWHADSLLWKRDLTQLSTRGQVDIPRLEAGNVALQVFTAVTKSPHGLNYDENAADALDDITLLAVAQAWPPETWTSLLQRALYQGRKLHRFAAEAPQDLKIITSRKDLEDLLAHRAAGERVVGGILGIEGAHALDGDINNVDTLYDAGFRVMSLQHFFDNRLGGSLHGAKQGGLTDFGKAVLKRMLTHAIVIDVAHSSSKVVADVLDIADRPIIVSHTGMYGYCPGPRNIPDALMKRVAAAGGLVGIGYWKGAVCKIDPKGVAGAIVYAVNTLGPDHVSLGSDYDGTVTTAFAADELSALTQALLNAGLSPDTIAKVMGGNMVRLLRQQLPAA